MQLQELRKELVFNKDLLALVETLKNVAASQYHQMEKQKERFDQFLESFADFFRVVNLVAVEHPLVRVASDILGVIVVTSDSGFMGGLNQGVMRAALSAQAEDVPNDKVSLVVIGDKGANFFSDQGREFKFFGGIGQETMYEQAVEVKDFLVQEILARRMGKVVVAHPRANSFSSQEVRVVNLLPCAELFDRSANSVVAEHTSGAKLLSEARNVIVESSFPDMVEYLAGVWVTSKLYEVFEDSKLAEFSARAMHLEGSLQKVEKDFKRVKHRVFKAVHELIDKGMRESFAAKMIKEKKKRKKRLAARQKGRAA